jgi:probable HAF family extracellular repeat protein
VKVCIRYLPQCVITLLLLPTSLSAAVQSATPHYTARCIGRISDLIENTPLRSPTVDDLRSLSMNVALNSRGDVLVGFHLYHRGHWTTVRIRHPKWLDDYAESGASTVGMNDAGDIIAVDSSVADGAWLTTDSRALLLRRGTQTELPMADSVAAINDVHQVLLSATSQHTDASLDTTNCWLYDLRSHRSTALGEGTAVALNDRGDAIVGDSLLLWRHGHRVSEDVPDSIDVARLNNNDVILGRVYVSKAVTTSGMPNEFTTTCHAAIYAHGRTTMLPVLRAANSTPEDLNDAGQVVGAAQMNVPKSAVDPIQTHAFLYQCGRTMDLNALLVGVRRPVLTDALRINCKGQILAIGNGCFYLLTPRLPL